MRLSALVLLFAGACASKPKVDRHEGAQLFALACARCHGAEGRGGVKTDAGRAPRNFHDADFHASRSDEQIRMAIVKGKDNTMPAFGAMFTDEQVLALVAHLRTFDPRPK